jgi:hypothetical protein
MRRIALLAAALLVALTAGASFAAKPAKHTSEPALGGYCPVAYVAANKAVKGDPKFAVTRAGRTYLFVNADAKKLYVAAPATYTVGYDSWCATAMAMGQKVKSDPTLFTLHGGSPTCFRTPKPRPRSTPTGHVREEGRRRVEQAGEE